MSDWSGENWWMESPGFVQTLEVIEKPPKRPKKGKKKQKIKKVPFGFARALPPTKRKSR